MRLGICEIWFTAEGMHSAHILGHSRKGRVVMWDWLQKRARANGSPEQCHASGLPRRAGGRPQHVRSSDLKRAAGAAGEGQRREDQITAIKKAWGKGRGPANGAHAQGSACGRMLPRRQRACGCMRVSNTLAVAACLLA